jgi:Fic family protein
LPQVSVPLVAKDLDISQPTARSSLNALVKLDILTEITGKQRDKVYVYKQYLDILEYGAEPI